MNDIAHASLSDSRSGGAGESRLSANGSLEIGVSSWFALIVFIGNCLFTTLLVVMLRAPFNSPPLMAAVYYALIGVSVILAYGAGEILASDSSRRFGVFPVVFAVIALAVPFASAYLSREIGLGLIILIVAASLVVIIGRRPVPAWQDVVAGVAFAAMFTFYGFLTVNAMGQATVLSPEHALTGSLQQDTLYHSAIASMFQTFGVPSTGLDGIPLTHYHTLSHIWLGNVAGEIGLNAVFGYFLGKQIVLLPLLFFSIAVATKSMVYDQSSRAAGLASVVFPIALLLLLGLVDWNSYFVSETHIVGLIFVLLGLPLLVALTKQFHEPVPMASFVVACLIGLMACASKVSSGGVFLAGFYYLMVRSRKLTLLQYAMLALFGSLVLWILKAFFLPDAHVAQSKLAPFHFLFTYVVVAIANLVPILVAGVICVLRWQKRENRPLQEVLLVMLAASTVPALALKVDGGSAYYFLNIGTWIAVAVIAASLVRIVSQHWARQVGVAAVVVALLLMGTDLMLRQTLQRFSSSLVQLQGLAMPGGGSGEAMSITDRLETTPLGRLTATVERNRDKGPAPIVMIEPELWDMVPFSCPSAPFFVPAYLGLPLLVGLQTAAAKCELEAHYSFPDYGQQSPPQSDLGDDEICALAISRDFARVIYVETLDKARILDCR